MGQEAGPLLLLLEARAAAVKNVVDGHKPAIAFTEDQNHFLLYTTAAPFQNMPVKPAKLLPTQVLPTNRVDKSPVFEEWRPWAGQIEPGWFFTDDLPAARAHLHAQNHVARVACTHKRELRKLVVQLGPQDRQDAPKRLQEPPKNASCHDHGEVRPQT